MERANRTKAPVEQFTEPPAAQALFGHVRWAWIWLIVRLYVGWTWIQAGWGKWHSPTWTGSQAGSALAGFVNHALTLEGGANPSVQGWFGWFLQHVVLPNTVPFSYLVSTGELLVGIGLILGAFTGIAAFAGSFMNMNYLLAGTVSLNPVLFGLEVLLVLAWRTAGWWGLDRWILPLLGTPWRPGVIFQHREEHDGKEHGGSTMAEHPGTA